MPDGFWLFSMIDRFSRLFEPTTRSGWLDA
jgi:hypothetical protein